MKCCKGTNLARLEILVRHNPRTPQDILRRACTTTKLILSVEDIG